MYEAKRGPTNRCAMTILVPVGSLVYRRHKVRSTGAEQRLAVVLAFGLVFFSKM